jgi:hypothetical protein
LNDTLFFRAKDDDLLICLGLGTVNKLVFLVSSGLDVIGEEIVGLERLRDLGN